MRNEKGGPPGRRNTILTTSRILAAIVILTLALSSDGAAPEDALTLKKIMQGLRNDLIKITDGLLVDDLALIAEGARGIAQHPSIPADQVKLVVAELGPEMPAFKQLDTQVHDFSVELEAAAARKDRDAAYRSYRALSEGCLACHTAYKARVSSVLAAAAAP